MRVIAGIARGRRLASPPAGAATRPTSDKVREALFSVLGEAVLEARVLDLFAGTGALGIEALSRGARHATFVEADRGLCEIVRQNLATVGLGDRATVLTRDVRRAASALTGGPYDLVLMDPPYSKGLEGEALRMLVAAHLLAPDALVVVEHTSRETPTLPPEVAAVLEPERTRVYGDTAFTTYLARGEVSPASPDGLKPTANR
jgi:16S rRNA (guanine966-N2)-methyltransferase